MTRVALVRFVGGLRGSSHSGKLLVVATDVTQRLIAGLELRNHVAYPPQIDPRRAAGVLGERI